MQNLPTHFYPKTTFLKITLLTFFLFSLSGFSKIVAQPNVEWELTYGGSNTENAEAIQPTSDGGYIVISYSTSSDGPVGTNRGGKDAWITKLEPFGQIAWSKSFGGSEDDFPRAVRETPDGGFIVVSGTESDDFDIGENNGVWDIWVVKLNALGDLMWEKNYGGSETDYPTDVLNTPDGGYLVLGYTTSNNQDVSANYGANDVWILKLNGEGVLEWEKNYGGSATDLPIKIFAKDNGSYVVGAYTLSQDGDVSTNMGSLDYWIFQINSSGQLEWEQSFGGSGNEVSTDMTRSSDGGFILTGGATSMDGDVSGNTDEHNPWVIKIDADGNLIWEKIFEDIDVLSASNMTTLLDGKYIMTDDQDHIYQIDEDGNLDWKTTLSNPLYSSVEFFDVEPTPDNGFILTGFAKIETGVTVNFQSLLVKMEGSPLSNPCPGDLAGFTTLGEFGDSKYYLSDESARPTDAQNIALANGGFLAAINSQEENDFLQQNISEMIYIGLNDFDEEGNLVWSNGESLNYNNINPCGFCEENSEEQDFVILQPWDGGWSFSNFYNQRKYVMEVPCGNTPTVDPDDCSFATYVNSNVLGNVDECVEESADEFRWVISTAPAEIFGNQQVDLPAKESFDVSKNGDVDDRSFTDFFNVPTGFTFLGHSKNLPLAYVFNNFNQLALCELNWQEWWTVTLPFGTIPEFLQLTEFEDVLIITGTTGTGNGEIFFVKLIDIFTGNLITETALPPQIPSRFSEAERSESGDFYIFGSENIFKLDDQLDLLWQSEFQNTLGINTFSMGISPDESAVFAGINWSQHPMMAKINAADGTTVWEKFLDDLLPLGIYSQGTNSFSGVAASDGGVVVGYNTIQSPSNSPGGYVLEKFSSDGDLVWQRLYGADYQNFNLQLATSSGGYVLTKIDDGGQHTFLKVTSEGLLDPLCEDANLPDLNMRFAAGISSNSVFEVGDEFQINYIYENRGFVDIDQDIEFRFYFTQNTSIDSTDILVDTETANGLEAQFPSEGIIDIQIPANLPAGDYYLAVVADEGNAIAEIYENNNIKLSRKFEVINNSTGNCITDLQDYISLGEFGGSTYFLSETTAKPLDAQIKADEVGGHLVSVNSQAENDFLANQISEMVYIGLFDYATEDEVRWFNNDPVDFTNFDICDFCNDNSDDLDFVVMHSWNGGWSWSSIWNSRKYIVELPCPVNLDNDSANNFASVLSENNTVSFTQNTELRLEEIFPNPAREYIVTKISASEASTVEVQIFDARGALVKTRMVNLVGGENQIEFDVHELSSGVYSVFVRDAELGHTTLRFVK